MIQQITVLGATGSIGQSTLDVIARHPDRYAVYALTAHSDVDTLLQQCLQFRPRYAVISSEVDRDTLAARLAGSGVDTDVLSGAAALAQVAAADEVAVVMAAIVGAAGLLPTMAAVQAGKKVLLANKESLVMAGGLFMQAVRESGAILLPIDSEHNAIFQCLPQHKRYFDRAAGVSRILLTGSGGPFRALPLEQLAHVTPEQACQHPNWSMGRKISVDSATMMNKGLELIEACWLFDAGVDDIEIVIHPQSIVHSMVQFSDGSTLAQLGNPDMRTPIAHALAWPERMDAGVAALDFHRLAELSFSAPDEQRFPCLVLARQAFVQGGSAPAVLNAANEVAVDAFLQQRIAFTDIARINSEVLARAAFSEPATLSAVIEADLGARELARALI